MLTCEETIAKLRSAGRLRPLRLAEIALGSDLQPFRFIDFAPRMQRFWDHELPVLPREELQDIDPWGEAVAYMINFLSGQDLSVEVAMRHMTPHDKFVWELRTGQLRFFGWPAARDHMILTAADTAERLHKFEGLHNGYRDEAIRFRDECGLGNCLIKSRRPGDVFSNAVFG